FAQTIARQFLFSTWQKLFYEKLVGSTDRQLAEIAAKALKETTYHAELAADWVVRVGDGTEESHRRLEEGFAWCWRFVDELFEMDDLERGLAAKGIAVNKAALRPAFDAVLDATLAEATLTVPALPRAIV